MARYRSKPAVIEAEQYAAPGQIVKGICTSSACHAGGRDKPHVHTIHDDQAVYLELGDFIVPEPDGEHYYPVKPAIFRAKYEPDT